MSVVAFIGLGTMGFPMAGHLVRAGHRVAVYNRTVAKAERWRRRYGGEVAASPAAAVREADFAILCVGGDDDVRQVVTGPEGVLAGARAGLLVVDHTTTSATLAEEMAERCAEREVAYVDAPVSGGQQGAERGTLTAMCGCAPELFPAVAALLSAYAPTVRRLGPVGSGQLCKMVNQICIAGLLQGLAEGLLFAERVGLDPFAVVEVISKGAAQSWQMDHRHATMIRGEFGHGFAVDWMRKDLGIALEEGRRRRIPLPVTALVDQFYAEIQNLGGGRWDTSSLIARLRSFQPSSQGHER